MGGAPHRAHHSAVLLTSAHLANAGATAPHERKRVFFWQTLCNARRGSQARALALLRFCERLSRAVHAHFARTKRISARGTSGPAPQVARRASRFSSTCEAEDRTSAQQKKKKKKKKKSTCVDTTA